MSGARGGVRAAVRAEAAGEKVVEARAARAARAGMLDKLKLCLRRRPGSLRSRPWLQI
jgi:hypothetical protein